MKRVLIITALIMAFALAAPAWCQSFDYDMLVKGGAVVDGTGAAPYSADIGIKDGRIVKIGDLKDAVAKDIIDATGMFVCPGFVQLWLHPTGEAFREDISEYLVEGISCRVKLGSPGDFPAAGENPGVCAIPQGKVTVLRRDKSPVLFMPSIVETDTSIETDLQMGSFGVVADPANSSALDKSIENKSCFIINPDPDSDPVKEVEEAIRLARKASAGVILPLPYNRLTSGQVDKINSILNGVRPEKLPLYIAAPQVPGGGYTMMKSLFLPGDRSSGALSSEQVHAAVRDSFAKYSPNSIYPVIPGRNIVSLSRLAKFQNKTFEETAISLMEKNRNLIVYYTELITPETYVKLISLPETFIADSAPVGLRGQEGLNSFPWRYSHMKNLMNIEKSVMKITSMPADAMGIVDHGRLDTGAAADIVIIDPKSSLKPFAPKGYAAYVIESGRLALKNGMPTGICSVTTPMRRGYGDQKTFNYLTSLVLTQVKQLGDNAGISVYNLKTGDTWNYNGDMQFFTAGAMRLPVLCSLLYDFTEGRTPYTTKVKITYNDQYPEGGLLGRLDTPLDITLRDLAQFIGAVEDDTALDKYIAMKGLGKINKTMELLGRKDIVLNADMRNLLLMQAGEDMKGASLNTPRQAWEKYTAAINAAKSSPDKKLPPSNLVFVGINQAAPASMLMLLKDMYEMKLLKKEDTDLFKQILSDNINPGLCSDLPYGTGSLSLGGAVGKNIGEAAVINTPGGPVAVVVMVNGYYGDTAYDADKILSHMGKTIYDFYNPEK